MRGPCQGKWGRIFMESKEIVGIFDLDGERVVLRYPNASDMDGLLALVNSLVRERAMIGVQKYVTMTEEIVWLDHCLKRLEDRIGVFLVVDVGNKIMGAGGITKSGYSWRNHIGELDISLRKEIRCRGVGEKLLFALTKEAKKILKIKIVELETMGKNKTAQRLYKKAGFKKVGVVKKGMKFYKKYEDSVHMIKYL